MRVKIKVNFLICRKYSRGIASSADPSRVDYTESCSTDAPTSPATSSVLDDLERAIPRETLHYK